MLVSMLKIKATLITPELPPVNIVLDNSEHARVLTSPSNQRPKLETTEQEALKKQLTPIETITSYCISSIHKYLSLITFDTEFQLDAIQFLVAAKRLHMALCRSVSGIVGPSVSGVFGRSIDRPVIAF